MILACPRCTRRYSILPEDLGEEGRQVRCVSCQMVWFQNREPEIHAQPHVEPIPTLAQSPEELSSWGTRVVFGVMMGLSIGMVGGAIFGREALIHRWPQLRPFYELIGLGVPFTFEALELKDISWSPGFTPEGSPLFLLQGRILNITDRSASLPSLQITFLRPDEKGDLCFAPECILAQWPISLPDITLAPHQVYPLDLSIPRAIPDGVSSLYVEFDYDHHKTNKSP